MALTFKTHVALQQELESRCEKAIDSTCDILLDKLQELIDSEFYSEAVYQPTGKYRRTYQFLHSAMKEMVSQTCGKIFMEPSAMNYKGEWNGEIQINEANVGSHGGYATDVSVRHRYFDAFVDYCNENAVRILKEELQKQGLHVK